MPLICYVTKTKQCVYLGTQFTIESWDSLLREL